MSAKSVFDHFTGISFSHVSQFWPRCENCDRAHKEESDFELRTYFTHYNKQWVTLRICKECSEPRNIFITETSNRDTMRYSATVYGRDQMIIGFGPTEPAAVENMREKYAESFNRDLCNFRRA